MAIGLAKELSAKRLQRIADCGWNQTKREPMKVYLKNDGSVNSKLLPALVLLWFFGLSPSLWAADQPVMRAHFLNIGQGDMTLLEFPCGAVLIDTGSQNASYTSAALEYFNLFFDRRTDLNRTFESLVITHNHTDHTKALEDIAEQFTVKRFFDNGDIEAGGGRGPKWLREEVAAGRKSCRIQEILNDQITALPEKLGLTDDEIDPLVCSSCDPKIVFLAGRRTMNPNWNAKVWKNPNNHSIVVRVDFGESSFLFTGDLEEQAIDELLRFYNGTQMLDIDVYQVGHHGSDNGTTVSFLETMTPNRAVISCGPATGGCGGQTAMGYGHPRWSTLDALEDAIRERRSRVIFPQVATAECQFGTRRVSRRVYATPWDGNIVITARLDGWMRADTEK